MSRLLAFLLALALTTLPALTETILVRSGDHPSFSRLVLPMVRPFEWSLGRKGDSYELQVQSPDTNFDLSDVFKLISKSRIRNVVADGPSVLKITVAENVHASAFKLATGALVIDVKDGTPPLDSTFERDLNEKTPIPAARSYPVPERRDPELAFYWRDAFEEPQKAPPPPQTAAAPKIQPLDMKLPDPRVATAEEELLKQLGRAASQGLLKVDPANPPHAENHVDTPQEALPKSAPIARDHLAITSQTAVDRDTSGWLQQSSMTQDGDSCLEAALLNLSDWVDDTPPSEQISSFRRGLLGEFDKPDPDKVLALARLYIALGFGDEAVALLDAMGSRGEATDVLRILAQVIDERSVDPTAGIMRMADCDTPAALWAVLANNDLEKSMTVDFGAVQRAFSALPLSMRQHLGPRLAEKMIVLGAADVARSIQGAISRAPGDHEMAVNLIDARIDMATGDAASAEVRLAPVIADDGVLATDALLLAIDARLELGGAVDAKVIDSVAALAFVHQDAEDGAKIALAHVLAAGSAGRFDEAFRALEDWPIARDHAIRERTIQELFRQIADAPNDEIFLKVFFARRAFVDKTIKNWELRANMAERLIELGFSAPARQISGPNAAHFDRGRLLLARASLLDRDGSAALTHVAGISGVLADRIRGEAFRLLGDHESAKSAFMLAGDQEAAVDEAWRLGDWNTVLMHGTDAQRQAIKNGALRKEIASADGESVDVATDPQLAEDGILARNRALLAESLAARSALSALLAETADK